MKKLVSGLALLLLCNLGAAQVPRAEGGGMATVEGDVDLDEFIVPPGEVAQYRGTVSINVAGDAIIDGTLIGSLGSSDAQREVARSANITIEAKGQIVVNGDIIGATGRSGARSPLSLRLAQTTAELMGRRFEPSRRSTGSIVELLQEPLLAAIEVPLGLDQCAAAFRGGRGGSVSLRAPVIVVNGRVVGGRGGDGAPGGAGGDGGNVLVVGVCVTNSSDSEPELIGGRGGDGATGGDWWLPRVAPDGGNGGNASCIGADELDEYGIGLCSSRATLAGMCGADARGGDGGNGANGTDARGAIAGSLPFGLEAGAEQPPEPAMPEPHGGIAGASKSVAGDSPDGGTGGRGGSGGDAVGGTGGTGRTGRSGCPSGEGSGGGTGGRGGTGTGGNGGRGGDGGVGRRQPDAAGRSGGTGGDGGPGGHGGDGTGGRQGAEGRGGDGCPPGIAGACGSRGAGVAGLGGVGGVGAAGGAGSGDNGSNGSNGTSVAGADGLVSTEAAFCPPCR